MLETSNQPYRVILWGMGNDYESLLSRIYYEISKGNMEVVGIVCADRYCKKKDGFRVYSPSEFFELRFDYVIITTSTYFEEIKKTLAERGISENRIINGMKMFNIPLFDFREYVSLIENPVTIISDDCWSGYVYNRLGLEFTTPFVNIYWDRDEYIKLIEKPEFYLRHELQIESEESVESGKYPEGRLGDTKDYVTMKFNHSKNFAEAQRDWNRRLERVNYNNLFVKMGFPSNTLEEKKRSYIEAFSKITNKKILFFYTDENIDCCFKSERFVWKQETSGHVEFFNYNDYMRTEYIWDINILKLLTTGVNYSRYV